MGTGNLRRAGPRRLGLAALVCAAFLLVPAAAAADPGDFGYTGPSFTGANAGVPPSGSRPESKLWWNDGVWWASMFDTGSGDFYIFRLDTGTQAWTRTGVRLDDRNNSIADVLWDGATLYVASHVYSESPGPGYQMRLYRFSYNSATDLYSLDSGFPALIDNHRVETMVIAKDTTGQLWATWTSGGQVWVNRTVCNPTCNDATWGTSFPLATPAIDPDDISSIVAFGGNRVGVMWSNEAQHRMSFAIHNDVDGDTTWSMETALAGTNMADDHISLKADAAGRVFAATKTSQSGSSNPLTMLLVRTAAGTWVSHVYGTVGNSHTRPIVVLDNANGLVRMFATVGQSGGTIYEKTLPFAAVEDPSANFPSGVGTARIRDADALKMNNATSTKQNLDGTTGLVVLATNKQDSRKDYWHHYDSLGGSDATAPLLQSASANGAALTLTYDEALNGSSVPPPSSFTVSVGSVPGTVSATSVAGGTVTLTLTTPVVFGDILSLDYTPGAGPIEDAAGNDAAPLLDVPVTNGTTAAGGPVTLLPTGDGTSAQVKDQSGGVTSLFAAIDETVAGSDNGTTYVRNNNNADATYFAILTDTPAGFGTMLSLAVSVRVRTTGVIDDTTTLYAQVFAVDGTTPLTNEVLVSTNPGPSGFVTVASVAFTGVMGGTQSLWDGARLRLRWDHIAVGVADGAQIRVSAVEVEGTFG